MGSHHCDFFVARTPLLPANSFLGADAMEGEYAERRERAMARLRCLVARPEIREALVIASPGLWERIQKWLDGERSDGIELAVTRYLERMSLRCTPFGLFAGVSVGDIGANTELRLRALSEYRRHTRIDMGYLSDRVDRIASDPAVRESLRFRPNSSCARFAGRLHYFEGRTASAGRQYFLVAVEEDEALRETLARARGGATLAQLSTALVDAEISPEEAREYVAELVSAQLLVPELAPSITGGDPLQDLIEQLASMPTATSHRSSLLRLRGAIDDLDGRGLVPDADSAGEAARQLLDGNPDANPAHLLQTDLTKPADRMQLGQEVVEEVQRAFALLHDLFSVEASDGLDSFRKAFRERYGDAEVPLAEALDEEYGIGFRASRAPAADAQPLLRGLDVVPTMNDSHQSYGPVRRYQLSKLCEALSAGADEIEIREEEIQAWRANRSAPSLPVPDTFSVMASIWQEGGGCSIALGGGGGPSGVRLLGRFTPFDEELERRVRDHVCAEQALHPEKLFFEIVHLPEGRLGNVLCRSVLRDHELSLLGRGNAKHQLELDDLMISLRDDRIVLRSQRLDRELVPRLSSAHNAARRSIGIYRFLFALQPQGAVSGLRWNWGPLDQAPFLPRVRYRAVILAPARWNVRRDEMDSWRKSSPQEFFDGFRTWARSRGLPRCFCLSEGDRSLPVDSENPLSLEAFWDVVAKRPAFVLEEMLPPADPCAVNGPEGGFVHELTLPFVRRNPASAVVHARPATVRTARRELGSDWIYAKIYCGKATADSVLLDEIAPLLRTCSEQESIERWFFIRYEDPAAHLRLRVQGDSARLIGELQPRLLAALAPHQESGRIWRLQFDGYDREIDRYGGPEAMALCEEIFAADSEAVVECLDQLRNGSALDRRWRIALRGVDALLEDFGLDAIARYRLYDRLSAGFRREFQAEQQLKRQVLTRFREERVEVAAVLSRNGELPESLRPSVDALARRSERIASAVRGLQRLQARGALTRGLDDVLGSLLHMHVNRMSRSAARAQEMVMYSMLAAHYDSELARQGIKGEKRRQMLREMAGG